MTFRVDDISIRLVHSSPLRRFDPFGLDSMTDCAMGGYCNPLDREFFDYPEPRLAPDMSSRELANCIIQCNRTPNVIVPCYALALGVGLGSGSFAGLCAPPSAPVTALVVGATAFGRANLGCRIALSSTYCADRCRKCKLGECE